MNPNAPLDSPTKRPTLVYPSLKNTQAPQPVMAQAGLTAASMTPSQTQPQPVVSDEVQIPVRTRASIAAASFTRTPARSAPVAIKVTSPPVKIAINEPTPVVPVSRPIPIVSAPAAPAPKPVLTIPVYSSFPPQPVAVKVIEKPKPLAEAWPAAPQVQPMAPQQEVYELPPELEFEPYAAPVSPATYVADYTNFEPEEKRGNKLVTVFASMLSIAVLVAGTVVGLRYVHTLQNPAAPKTDQQATTTQSEKTQVAAVKGTNTTATLDEASKLVQAVGDKMLGFIKADKLNDAYALTSQQFKGVTNAVDATSVFTALKPTIDQSALTYLQATCYPASSATELTSDSLCGGIYGFKDPAAHQKDYYVIVIADYNFASIHSIRGFEVATNTPDTVKTSLEAMLKNVKQSVDN